MEKKSDNYLATLSEYALSNGTLSEEDIHRIQNKLWILLGKRTERYTMGDSSSVPIKIAQELLKSICYCIDMHLKLERNMDTAIFLMKSADMEKLLALGLADVEKEIDIGKKLLQKASAGAPQINNISYHDTLTEINSFFKKYDHRFFAHEIPCMIDYQLCHEVSGLQGIEYINEYLHHLIMENELCAHFKTNTIISLLRAYCPNYKEELINIYTPVAVNAIGLTLLHKSVFTLDITKEDRIQLLDFFKLWSEKEAIEMLTRAVKELCYCLDIQDISAQEYLQNTAVELYDRIKSIIETNCFDNLFLSLYCELKEVMPLMQYIDEDMMDDEELRKLIDEMLSCRFLSDKIAIVKQQIHSLQDLVEVLNLCFWQDECIELFNTLNNIELAILLGFLYGKRAKAPHWHSDSQWELQLTDYMSNLESPRKIEIENIL